MYHYCRYLLVVLCISYCFLTNTANGERALSPKCHYQQSDFGRFVKIVMGLLDFFERYMQDSESDIVLDAAVGTRILEEQLVLTLKSNHRLPIKIRNFLNQLLLKTKTITGSIIESVKNSLTFSQQEKKYTMPWITTSALFQTPELYDWKMLPTTLISKIDDDTYFSKPDILNETLSDICIGLLFENIKLTEECSKVFLTVPLYQYSLTHQVIYMLIAKKMGCLSLPIFQTKIEKDFQDRLCSKVWIEANYISTKKFPLDLRDLFAEQIVVCSLAGFEQFLKHDWLQIILTWHSPISKCFLHFENEDTERPKNSGSEFTNGQFGRTRKKRYDVVIKVSEDETCSAHLTAIGIAALGIHIRKMLEECLI